MNAPCTARQVNLEPLGHSQMRDVLQAAVADALRDRGWLLLGGGAAVEADLLGLAPGQEGAAAMVELEAGVQEPATLLLFVKRAGGPTILCCLSRAEG
jgi:hypothetical protein